ncbi:hypothetical protein CU098_010677, partial [Rhizopus stolonifer]
MTIDNIPYSNPPPPERMDSLYYKHLPTQDHVPVAIEDVAYTTGVTTTSDSFRKRNQAYT